MKKKVIIAAAAAAAVVIIGVGIWFFVGRGSKSSGGDAVYVSKISKVMDAGNLGMENRFSGVVEPQQTAEVQLAQDKTVKEVLVEAGQDVVAGTPLFTYDTTQTESDLSQAQLDVDRINNDIENLYSQIKTLEKEKRLPVQMKNCSTRLRFRRRRPM